MPKVLNYTPAWLSRPSPGFDLFSSKHGKPSGKARRVAGKNSEVGHCRTIARRGTEVFVVVGNTIRWADLCILKDDYEGQEQGDGHVVHSIETHRGGENEHRKESSYRTLKAPVHEQIKQLILSPNGELLAILTRYTVHIAILPDSSHLDQPDTGDIRLKTHTLGPTTHVLSQSPVTTALWHPLGVGRDCLVTVTQDAVVRLWELNRQNRSSFDNPALAVDLKKLQHGTNAEDDFSATRLGTNRGFSLDALDMEVVSACFGGIGSEVESGWCPMTLWVAMAEGDVYALCPLLPSKWQPPSTLIPSLTTSVAAHKSGLEQELLPPGERFQCEEQYRWLTDIDLQDPVFIAGEYEISPEIPIYERPARPGPVPKLQGPFRIVPEEAEDGLELSDILVIASRLDMDDIMEEEEGDEGFEELPTPSLSSSIVCLLSRSGRVYVCLDLEGVEAQWLPSRKSKSENRSSTESSHDLLLIEAVDIQRQEEIIHPEWPTFTSDVHSSYSFFIGLNRGITFLSLDPWVSKLESELQSGGNAGAEFRLEVFTQSSGSLREQILKYSHSDDDRHDQPVPAPVVLQDSDLGYFLLTVRDEQPYAVLLDSPHDGTMQDLRQDDGHDYEPDIKQLTQGPARIAYQPPRSLWADSSLSKFADTHVPSRYRKTLKDEIRLSSATLDIMTEAHRVLSQETHQLGIAAADLFRRCERLLEEFRDQITRADEVASRVEQLNDEDADDYEEKSTARGSAKIEERLQAVKGRQVEITARHEALRRKLARAGGKDLSDKEQAWATEVNKLAASILSPEDEAHDGKQDQKNELWERFDEARTLAADLVSQTHDASQSNGSDGKPNGAFKIPPDIRREKVGQVMALLERETALVDAAQERLERLSLSAI
ncbi:hypothetical protein MMC13_001686 [Lambiella insularis]|nr:hypothetical protein [Lambiella insularis]